MFGREKGKLTDDTFDSRGDQVDGFKICGVLGLDEDRGT